MRRQLKNLFKRRLFYHYIFWVFVIIGFLLGHGYLIKKTNLETYILVVILNTSFLLFHVYIYLNLLLPKLYQKKHYWLYGTSLTMLMLSFALAQSFFNYHISNNIAHTNTSFSYEFGVAFFTAFRYTFLAIILKLTLEWYDQKERLSSMNFEKLQAEVN